MTEWLNRGVALLIIGIAIATFILLRHGKVIPASQRPGFVPDLKNDKLIVVRGWKEEELQRILRDFAKMYELSAAFVPKAVPHRESTFRLLFPDDLAPDHFFFLINYLNYPIKMNAKGRTIGVVGRTTVTSQFDVPDQALIGKQVLVNVPANDQDYDQVDIRVESGPAFRWGFSKSTWQRLDRADVPTAIRDL